MKEPQAEIKAIQAKLQSLQGGRRPTQSRPASPPSELLQSNGFAAVALTGRVSRDNLAATVETLHQRSTPYLHPFQQLQQPPAQEVLERQIAEEIKRLESQAQRINQLSDEQESAMLELKAIADKVEQTWRAIELESGTPEEFDPGIPTVCEYLAAAVPHIERDAGGAFVVTSRSIDLFRAEREASLMAESLRHRAGGSMSSRYRRGLSHRQLTSTSSVMSVVERWGHKVWRQVTALVDSLTSSQRSRAPQPRQPEPEVMPSISWQDALIWVIGATTVRVGISVVLASFPGLWLPIAGLILTIAAIAIYRTTVSPQSGFIWGYRLFLIMIGLLIGGRLG